MHARSAHRLCFEHVVLSDGIRCTYRTVRNSVKSISKCYQVYIIIRVGLCACARPHHAIVRCILPMHGAGTFQHKCRNAAFSPYDPSTVGLCTPLQIFPLRILCGSSACRSYAGPMRIIRVRRDAHCGGPKWGEGTMHAPPLQNRGKQECAREGELGLGLGISIVMSRETHSMPVPTAANLWPDISLFCRRGGG